MEGCSGDMDWGQTAARVSIYPAFGRIFAGITWKDAYESNITIPFSLLFGSVLPDHGLFSGRGAAQFLSL